MVGEEGDVFGGDDGFDAFGEAFEELPFVGDVEVLDVEEGLSFSAVAVGGFFGGFIPDAFLVAGDEVVVLLVVVGGVVAGLAKVGGEHFLAGGHGNGDGLAVVLGSDAGRIHAGDDGAAGHGADGAAGIGVFENESAFGEAFDVGHGGSVLFVVETIPAGGVILGGEPDNVGLVLGGESWRAQGEDPEEEKHDGFFHGAQPDGIKMGFQPARIGRGCGKMRLTVWRANV